MPIKAISLYFHIPFCTKKCPYCHFYVIPNKPPFHKLLEEGLMLEIESKFPLIEEKEIVSIYFGGGTPSLFAPSGIHKILKKLHELGAKLSKTCEITIEVNPENGSEKLFESLFEIGINRLSIGVQSLDDRSLQTLERMHSAKKALDTLYAAQNTGFNNISIDLMYDLPDQTQASWNYTLSKISEIPIQHISLYNLTIEPHTSFYKRRKELILPDQTTSLSFLKSAIERFEMLGLHRYEISAFAKKGCKSKHNLGYWIGRPFLGLGPSAFSFWDGKRFRNIANLQRYTRALKTSVDPIDFEETLPFPQNLKELFAVHLRLIDGVDLNPACPEDMLLSIEQLKADGFLNQSGSTISLSEKGLLFYDTVASVLI